MTREFTLPEAESMAPLVRQILRDVADAFVQWKHCQRRDQLLSDCRKSANFEVRRQYYQNVAKMEGAEKRLQQASEELAELGVALLDPLRGEAGFAFKPVWSTDPTRAREPVYVLKMSDEPERGIRCWRFLDEATEYPIPQSTQTVTATAK